MDTVKLNVIEKGHGQPLVLVPGWSQTARGFQAQIDGLSSRYRVIALDMRGHGESPKPSSGYRISRLAQDLHDYLVAVDLDDVVLGGHSMGASIVWSYLEQFGGHRLSKLIFIDQAPTVVRQPGFSDQDALDAGAVFTPDALYATASAVAINQAATLETLKGAFFSPGFIAANAQAVADNRDQSLKMPAEYAARMLIDHCAQDWRDLLRHGVPTGLPVLVSAARWAPSSRPRWHAGSQVRFLAHNWQSMVPTKAGATSCSRRIRPGSTAIWRRSSAESVPPQDSHRREASGAGSTYVRRP